MPPLAPRPFSQMARRDVRMYGNTLQGLRPALCGAPWYRRMRRRRAAVALRRGQLIRVAARRSSRVFWLRYPPITVEAA